MLRRTLLLASAASLAGCGFALRRAPEFKFHRIALIGFSPKSATLAALRRGINGSTDAYLVEAVTQAEVVLQALVDSREQLVGTATPAGQIRNITLIARLTFQLQTPAGKVLIAPSELALARDMTYNETAALAKEQEADLLFRAMQEDLAQQVIRRLAAVRDI